MVSKNKDNYLVEGYLPTVGIECHVQLNCQSKLFSPVANQATDPNQAISPLCLGLPGALPLLNKEAVFLAIRAGLALNGEISLQSHFDRKHYFYPDLPLGYQISQNEKPIIVGGQVSFISPDTNQGVVVNLIRAHLEADAGKLSHPSQQEYSLLDLNRVGSPLLEIVSQPEIHSPDEAKEYAKQLHRLMVYSQVSDGNLQQGQMRFDVNVSLAKPGQPLGVRVEIKNLNSFRFIQAGLSFEIKRQLDLIKSGQGVRQETRGYDDAQKKTFKQRGKEDAPDYRYMPEPDLPAILISPKTISEVESQLPPLPAEIRQKLTKIGLTTKTQETLLDYPLVALKLFSLSQLEPPEPLVVLANLFIGELRRLVQSQETDWEKVLLVDQELLALAQAAASGQILINQAKDFLLAIISEQKTAKEVIEELTINAGQPEDVAKILAQICQQKPKLVKDFQKDPKVTGFFIGQVRQQLPKANPRMIKETVFDYLKKID